MHPATKQLDGRMQPQTLPSSLTVRPVFMASSHTTKTSAMPSNSTLHYAAKQLDDRQLEPKTPQQSLLHSNCIVPTHAGRHERNCSRLPSSRTVPEQTSRTLKMSAHGTSRTRLSPRAVFSCSIHEGNLEDLNEILHSVHVQSFPSTTNLEDLNEILLCVRVQPLPSKTKTLKTSTRSSSVSVFKRFHQRRQP